VFAIGRIAEAFCYPEVYKIYHLLPFVSANQEVLWLQVSMNEVFRVNKLKSLEALQANHRYGLLTELIIAKLEQRLQSGAKVFENHDTVISLLPEMIDFRDAFLALENFVNPIFIL
jgi:hypothetical protein